MKNLFTLLAVSIGLFAINTYGKSPLVTDGESLGYYCGGYVLAQTNDGRLSLKFDGNINRSCSYLSVYDYSSGKLIESYKAKNGLSGKTYILSDEQMNAISQDCKIKWDISTAWETKVSLVMTINNCRQSKKSPKYNKRGYYYELSNKGNCKKMLDGKFIELVSKSYCY